MMQHSNVKIIALLGLMLLLVATGVTAQEEVVAPDEPLDEPLDTPERILGISNADFEEVSVELFEDPTLWVTYISPDDGISIHQRFEGGPNAKVPLEELQRGGAEDANVLGVKTSFGRRGFTEIVFRPQRPVPIPGVVGEISLWVLGRELPHDLYVMVRDIEGREQRLFVETLNFRGWRRVSTQVPPSEVIGDRRYTGLKQSDPRRPLDIGLEVTALIIEPLYTEAYGDYYVYFDDMRAATDLSPITQRDPDDIVDAW